MFLPNMLLGCRFQIVGAKRRELELRSLFRTGVPLSRNVASVTDGSDAHEHMGVQNSGRHAIAETVEFDMTGLQVEHNVAIAGMVRSVESCGRSNLYMQEREKRTSSQPRIGADFVPSCGTVQRVDRLGLLLPCWHVNVLAEKMFDTRLACSTDVNKILLRRSRTRQWKAWAEKIVVEELRGGPWLEPVESVVFLKKMSDMWSPRPKAHLLCHWLSMELDAAKTI